LLKELQSFSIPTRQLRAKNFKHKHRVRGNSVCTCAVRNTALCWKWWSPVHETNYLARM